MKGVRLGGYLARRRMSGLYIKQGMCRSGKERESNGIGSAATGSYARPLNRIRPGLSRVLRAFMCLLAELPGLAIGAPGVLI